MKKWLLLLALFLPSLAHAQGSEIVHFANDPIFCDPTRGFLYYNTTSNQVKYCSALNTWSALGSGLGVGFNLLGNGTNTTAAMVVGTGASLSTSGTGTIAATSLGTGSSGLTGSVFTGVNAAPGVFTPVGLANRDVAGTTDTILCDTGTATQDRGKTVRYKAATATAVTIPDAGTSGCGNNFTVFLAADAAGTVTVSRTTSSTFDVVDGGSHSSGLTSFTLATGQWARVSSPDNATWFVQLSSFGLNNGGNLTGTFSAGAAGLQLTGNTTINAGINSHNFYVHNNILWTGNTSPPYKYTTLEASLAATECPAAGCRQDLVSGFSETFTSPITIGNATTNQYHVHGYPGSILTSNVSSGKSILLSARNTLTGEVLGATSGSSSGGLLIKAASTATGATLLSAGDDTLVGGNAFIRAENLALNGNTSATFSNAMFDIPAVNSMSSFHNNYIYGYGATIGVNVRSVNISGGVAGPLNIENVWSLGGYIAGSRPCVLQAQTNSILGINWQGGVCNQPGSGLTMMEINGNGTLNALRGINVHGTYLENLNNGSSIGIKVADVTALHVSGVPMALRDTDTAIDISQSITHGTTAFQATGVFQQSPTNLATLVNNHITGHTITGAALPFYNFGGDVGASIAPFTIESNNFQILDAANHQVVSIPAQANGIATMTFFNGADATMNFNLNSGLTASQQTQLNFTDRGTIEWAIMKRSDNSWRLQDIVNNLARISVTANAITSIESGAGTNANRFNDLANSGTGGIEVWSGGATPAKNAQITSGGMIVNVNATTPCTNVELVLSAGWGTTATVTTVVGTGQTCEWTLTSSGTGQAANPTVTDTLTNALPVATIVCTMQMVGGTGTNTLIDQTTLSATAPIFTFGGTPVAASTYKVVRRCGP